MAKKSKMVDPNMTQPVKSWDYSNLDDCHLRVDKKPSDKRKSYVKGLKRQGNGKKRTDLD
jgi:hypothetical protein